MERITTYTAGEVSRAIEDNEKLLLVHFGSPLASSCDLVRRELERIAPGFEGRVDFAEVELPLQDLDLIQRYRIETVPTLMLYLGPREVERVERLMLEEELNDLLELSWAFYTSGNSESKTRTEDL